MKTKEQFWSEFISPLRNAVLKKYPAGHIMQYWAENPALYSSSFKKEDEFSKRVCGHTGIDLATFEGDGVVAAHEGIIHDILLNSPFGGNVVYIKSPLFFDEKKNKKVFCITSYGHLKEVSVSKGQSVNKGWEIGEEGNTGFVVSGGVAYWNNAPASKGVHVHFGYTEFNEDWSYANPNCLGNTSDPLTIITYKNPDISGLQVLLINLRSYLLFLQRSLNS